MKGSIFTDEKCPICNSNLRDNRKDAVVCPEHPQIKTAKFRVHFDGVWKRFNNYNDALYFLNGVRYKVYEGSFDKRDYLKDNPLGFENLALEWLQIKEKNISHNTYRALVEHINKAVSHWGNRNVKEIRLKDFQFFLNSYDVSDKSKHNYMQTLKQFFKWLWDNEEIEKLPKFPNVSFELAWRKTISKETQQKILEELSKISNRKTWLGIKFLSTYFNVRPEELRNIREGHIDIEQGEIIIPHPKEKRPKIVYLLPEDVGLLKSFPKALNPELYFFRNSNGERFGEKYFYKWWKRACKNLGVEGVDLYGGTRHSTVRALRKYRTPEEIKLASMHSTNKAFERYFTVSGDDLRDIYSDTQGGNVLAMDLETSKVDK